MRKLILILCVALFLCSCVAPKGQTESIKALQEKYIEGVWLSFSEINEMLEDDFKGKFDTCIANCKSFGTTDIFVHVTAFADSLFDSQYFPKKEQAKKYTYDILEYMINASHENGIRFHAWMNPYRVSTATDDIGTLPDGNPAKKWLSDQDEQNNQNVCIYNGIYLNPASTEVRKHIINSIREIVLNYQVDGIHFDDYFYPIVDEKFDEVSYDEYASKTAVPLSLDNWRRASVNALISGCYTAIKFINKDIIFSVSPAASIDKNYNEYFADVEAWIKSGCVDIIIPQLYFGFNYPDVDYGFENLLNKWKAATEQSETKLCIGLAAYKVGTETEPDCFEWQDENVLSNQVNLCLADKSVGGYCFFSYSYLFSENPINVRARENIIEIKKEPE